MCDTCRTLASELMKISVGHALLNFVSHTSAIKSYINGQKGGRIKITDTWMRDEKHIKQTCELSFDSI